MNRKELAEAMLKGIQTPGVQESDSVYVSNGGNFCSACALGAALIGHLGGNSAEAHAAWRGAGKRKSEGGPIAAMSDLLCIPESLAEEVESKHCEGYSIQQIADWLNGAEETDVLCQ